MPPRHSRLLTALNTQLYTLMEVREPAYLKIEGSSENGNVVK